MLKNYLRIPILIFRYMLLLLLFYPLVVSAEVHGGWHRLYTESSGEIKEVDDPQKDYKVTEFISQSSRDTYINGAQEGSRAWHDKDKIITWEQKFKESYVIIIAVNTKAGKRTLIYTPAEVGGAFYFGLGALTMDGQWHHIRRDLEADLQRYEPENSIIEVNAFLVRGSGRMGNIQLLAEAKRATQKPKEEISPSLKEFKPQKHQLKPKVHLRKSTTHLGNTPPVITLNQGELIYHQLGEPFFDPSATATDSSGKPLSVETLGEVNINQVGRYVLTYIATDHAGNSATKARVVMVHRTGVGTKHPKEEPLSKNPIDLYSVGGAEEDMPLPIDEIESLD